MTQDNMMDVSDEILTMTAKQLDAIVAAKVAVERKQIHITLSEMYHDEKVGLQYGLKNRNIYLKGRQTALLELVARTGMNK